MKRGKNRIVNMKKNLRKITNGILNVIYKYRLGSGESLSRYDEVSLMLIT